MTLGRSVIATAAGGLTGQSSAHFGLASSLWITVNSLLSHFWFPETDSLVFTM